MRNVNKKEHKQFRKNRRNARGKRWTIAYKGLHHEYFKSRYKSFIRI